MRPSCAYHLPLLFNGHDIRFKLRLYGYQNDYDVIVQAVYQGSDAEAKRIKRGNTSSVLNSRNIGSNYHDEIDFLNLYKGNTFPRVLAYFSNSYVKIVGFFVPAEGSGMVYLLHGQSVAFSYVYWKIHSTLSIFI